MYYFSKYVYKSTILNRKFWFFSRLIVVLTSAVHLKTRPATQSQTKRPIASSSNYFLQNYIYKHQKPLKINTSHNPNSTVYENHELDDSKKIQQAFHRKVSFSDTPYPAAITSAEYKNYPFEVSKLVPLTIKNLELYNSQQKKTQLSAPSKDDEWIAEWLRLSATADEQSLPNCERIAEEETTAQPRRGETSGAS